MGTVSIHPALKASTILNMFFKMITIVFALSCFGTGYIFGLLTAEYPNIYTRFDQINAEDCPLWIQVSKVIMNKK